MSTDELRGENQRLHLLNKRHREISEEAEAQVRELRQRIESVRGYKDRLDLTLQRLRDGLASGLPKESIDNIWQEVNNLLALVGRKLTS